MSPRFIWPVLVLFGLFLGLFWGTSATQHVMSDEPKKSGSGEGVERGVPPDIKVGVKIQFVSGQLFTSLPDKESPKVIKIEGNWAYVEGSIRQTRGTGDVREVGSGWFNLSKLEWYRIVEEKKEAHPAEALL
jgi:hypothetical protein